MRIGMILECTSKGPDAIIYPYLAKLFCAMLMINSADIITLTNKANVMSEGPEIAKLLLNSGCDYVFIIWDRMPKWGGTGSCEDHKKEMSNGLSSSGVDRDKVFLCCIKDMLESWILGDGSAITEYFQSFSPSHRLRQFPDYKSAVEQSQPEEKLKRYNKRYDKYSDNFKIVKLIKDFDKISRRNDSFKYFKECVESICR
jgi:hypothetical protein